MLATEAARDTVRLALAAGVASGYVTLRALDHRLHIAEQTLAARADAQHAPTVQGVTLSSLHAAKGLEWDAVFLVGLTEGSLPISQAIKGSFDDVEEERRELRPVRVGDRVPDP